MAAGIAVPMPAPMIMRPGRRSRANDESTSINDSRKRPDAARVRPIGTMTLGPKRGRKRFVHSWAQMASTTICGRNRTPVCQGL